ncbi:16S rRNA processing protein RimM [Oscillospiraceae bacterium HV4-5-C5C]|nr:16S rRNA processing protein RimM [Oscillospiraceae bacterium HV4-5-C5C]
MNKHCEMMSAKPLYAAADQATGIPLPSDDWQRPYLHVARITAAHGIKGMVKAQRLSRVPGRLEALQQAYLLQPDESQPRLISLTVQFHQQLLLLKIEGIEDRDAAEQLRGCWVSLDRSQAGPAPQGHYYIADLIGCQVYDARRGLIGTLRDIVDGPGYDLYIIKRPGMTDLYLPAVNEQIRQIALEKRRIDVCLPEGLWEL